MLTYAAMPEGAYYASIIRKCLVITDVTSWSHEEAHVILLV